MIIDSLILEEIFLEKKNFILGLIVVLTP